MKEKLRIAYEQEIVRVHNRGARAAVNQETPLSLCTVLKDKESATVYHPFNALKVSNIVIDNNYCGRMLFKAINSTLQVTLFME